MSIYLTLQATEKRGVCSLLSHILGTALKKNYIARNERFNKDEILRNIIDG